MSRRRLIYSQLGWTVALILAIKHAGKESNLQPWVLEAPALPIAPPAYVVLLCDACCHKPYIYLASLHNLLLDAKDYRTSCNTYNHYRASFRLWPS